MSEKKHGLGRGLGDLGINELLSEIEAQQQTSSFRSIPIEFVQPGKYQPRRFFEPETLQDLAASIRNQGIIQPIVLREISSNNYEIVAGERRWRAAQLAGLHEVPAIIRELSNEAALALSLIENIQRENLNVIEEANALKRLLTEFALTHQEVADAIGKSRATVSNLLRLLDLDDEVKQLVEQSQLEMGHARALLTLDSNLQKHTAKLVSTKGLSVRETEQLVQRLQTNKDKKTSIKVDPDLLNLQQELAEKLGAKVSIQHSNRKGNGKLVIHYNSTDELNGLLRHIN